MVKDYTQSQSQDVAGAHNCIFCGAELPPGRPLFCSSRCKDSWKHYRMSKAEVEAKRNALCRFCGTPFVRKHLRMDFCCSSCKNKYRNNGNRSKAEVEQRLHRTCPACGRPYVASHGRQVYCSPECWRTASKANVRLTAESAIAGSSDPYAELLRRKLQQEQETVQDFEDVMALGADERRTVVSGWPEDKKRALRSFYIRQYGLSSGKTLRTFGVDTRDSDEMRIARRIDLTARASFERAVFDEDNMGFETV